MYVRNFKKAEKNRKTSLNKLRGSFNKCVTFSLNFTQSFQNSSTKNSQNSINDNTQAFEVDISDQINENYKFDTSPSSIEIDNEVEINKLQNESNSSGNDFIMNTVNDYDMTDIGCWPEIINNCFKKELIKLGPIQIKNYNFPQSEINGELRRFNPTLYDKRLDNGDVIRRNWLVYSKFKDRVFCFCCRHFDSNSIVNSGRNGINDWRHIGERLKSHESRFHIILPYSRGLN